MSNAVILDVVRTPIGKRGGALSTMRADELAALPLAEIAPQRVAPEALARVHDQDCVPLADPPTG